MDIDSKHVNHRVTSVSTSVFPFKRSLLPHYFSSNTKSRFLPHKCSIRFLLYCGVFYVCGLVLFLMYTWLSSPVDYVATANKHARIVKMLLPQDQTHLRQLRCISWRATATCSPYGPRLPHLDQSCQMVIDHTQSGYCEVEDTVTKERFRVMRRYCRSVRLKSQFQCSDAQEFVNFPVRVNKVISKAIVPSFVLPNMDKTSKGSKGIVMVVYPTMVPSAYASIRALREVLKCNLWIELWYREEEMHMVSGSMAPLQQLASLSGGISFHVIDDINATGFSAKVYAIYHSYFESVLFLDSDNVPVRDPSFLFETQEFIDSGAIFWPDFWHPRHTMFNIHGQSLLWELLNQQFVNMFEQESGQLVIDRRRHAAPLELVHFYTFHTPNLLQKFKLVHGDKDLFRLAWLKLKSPFHMIEVPPAVAGKVINTSFCGMTMVQHDADGKVLFLHRNSRKLIGEHIRQTVDLRALAVERIKQKLMLTQPNERAEPTMEEVEEEMRRGGATLAPTLDEPEADGYPDAIYWTHMLSFRNASRRVHYKIDVLQAMQGFAESQACYGVANMLERRRHFILQPFAKSSFSGLETCLRKFAMEAAQMVHAYPNNTLTGDGKT